MAALFCRWFEVADRRKCPRRAAGVSRVKSLLHNVHGPAEALPPTAIGFGKMDKVELRGSLKRVFRRRVAAPSAGSWRCESAQPWSRANVRSHSGVAAAD